MTKKKIIMFVICNVFNIYHIGKGEMPFFLRSKRINISVLITKFYIDNK